MISDRSREKTGASTTSKWKASVVGLGKAGLPLASVIADSGISVLGVDLSKNAVDMINKGINPIKEEPGLADLVKKHAGAGLKATTDAAKAAKESNVHIVIVPLFIDGKNKPDFSAINSALSGIAKGLKKNDLVVLETTVPVGTTEGMARELLEKKSGLTAGKDFFLAFSPERIMTGYSISRFREFPKIIGGINDASTKKAMEFYRLFSNIRAVADSRTAELAKIAEGIYRDVNIALANELYMAAENYGVDYWEMSEAAKHQYCNLLEPGNVGGHCIPVYPWFILNEFNAPLTKLARSINDGMVEHYAMKVDKILEKNGKKGKGAKVAVIGLSYREGVKEHAYARSLPLISLLKKKGYETYGVDSLYSKEEIKSIFGALPAGNNDLQKMDAIILMNKEAAYRPILLPMRKKVVDVKNVLG